MLKMLERLFPHSHKEQLFDVAISPDRIENLKMETDPEKRQNILDDIFTTDRRQKLLRTASKDSKGRKVRYFRKMNYTDLLKLLETGQQTYESYFDDPNKQVTDKDLDTLIRRFSIFSKQEGQANLSQIEQLKRIFTGFIPEHDLQNMLENLTYARIISVIDTYLPQEFKETIHSGSLGQVFSPYLSLSVGGIINMTDMVDRITVELIMPDETIIPVKTGFEGEKEVYVKKITTRNIARVYTSSSTLQREEVENPDTPIYQFNNGRIGDNAIGNWRWNEPTTDLLPSSIRRKIK